MIEQLSLEDARAARDVALDRVDDPPWRAFADRAIAAVAARRNTVTSEDVWAELDRMGIPRPAEARCMGPAMVAAVKAGLLATMGFTTGTNPKHHADVMRVYRSRAR